MRIPNRLALVFTVLLGFILGFFVSAARADDPLDSISMPYFNPAYSVIIKPPDYVPGIHPGKIIVVFNCTSYKIITEFTDPRQCACPDGADWDCCLCMQETLYDWLVAITNSYGAHICDCTGTDGYPTDPCFRDKLDAWEHDVNVLLGGSCEQACDCIESAMYKLRNGACANYCEFESRPSFGAVLSNPSRYSAEAIAEAVTAHFAS